MGSVRGEGPHPRLHRHGGEVAVQRDGRRRAHARLVARHVQRKHLGAVARAHLASLECAVVDVEGVGHALEALVGPAGELAVHHHLLEDRLHELVHRVLALLQLHLVHEHAHALARLGHGEHLPPPRHHAQPLRQQRVLIQRVAVRQHVVVHLAEVVDIHEQPPAHGEVLLGFRHDGVGHLDVPPLVPAPEQQRLVHEAVLVLGGVGGEVLESVAAGVVVEGGGGARVQVQQVEAPVPHQPLGQVVHGRRVRARGGAAHRLATIVGGGHVHLPAGVHLGRLQRHAHRALPGKGAHDGGELVELVGAVADVHLKVRGDGDVGHVDGEALGGARVPRLGRDVRHSRGKPRHGGGHQGHAPHRLVLARVQRLEVHQLLALFRGWEHRPLVGGGVDVDGLAEDLHVVDHAMEEGTRDAAVVVGAEGKEGVLLRVALGREALHGLVVHVQAALPVRRPRQRHHVPLVDRRHILEDGERLEDVVVVVHEALPVEQDERVVPAGAELVRAALKRQHRRHRVPVVQQLAALEALAAGGQEAAALHHRAGLRLLGGGARLRAGALRALLLMGGGDHLLGVHPEGDRVPRVARGQATRHVVRLHEPADAVALQALLLDLKGEGGHGRAQPHRHVRELRRVHLRRGAGHRLPARRGGALRGVHRRGQQLLVRLHRRQPAVVAVEGGLPHGAAGLRVRRRLEVDAVHLLGHGAPAALHHGPGGQVEPLDRNLLAAGDRALHHGGEGVLVVHLHAVDRVHHRRLPGRRGRHQDRVGSLQDRAHVTVVLRGVALVEAEVGEEAGGVPHVLAGLHQPLDLARRHRAVQHLDLVNQAVELLPDLEVVGVGVELEEGHAVAVRVDDRHAVEVHPQAAAAVDHLRHQRHMVPRIQHDLHRLVALGLAVDIHHRPVALQIHAGVLRGEGDVGEDEHRLLRRHRPARGGVRLGHEPHGGGEGGAHGAGQLVGGVQAAGARGVRDGELDGVFLERRLEGRARHHAAVVGHAHVVLVGGEGHGGPHALHLLPVPVDEVQVVGVRVVGGEGVDVTQAVQIPRRQRVRHPLVRDVVVPADALAVGELAELDARLRELHLRGVHHGGLVVHGNGQLRGQPLPVVAVHARRVRL
mmetsp:Transcript_28799/g.63070  ORF Transcript_28799/g.63070 Transcript_28799/m.63070 type:complete len:1108 (+) Transcript_28799:5250-8573(+)